MAYKQIDERFWKDQKVKRLSKDGYLFFLYLLTSPHTHYTGMSESMLDYVNIDTPLSERESKAAFQELASLGIIEYDKANKIVWIKNMHKYQVKSDKQKRGAELHLNSLPKSILCAKLAELLQIPYRYPIDTLSEVENTLSESGKYPIDTREAKAKEEAKEKAKGFDANAVELPECLKTDAFREAWFLWQQHRKEKKNPLTPTATKQQLKKLEEMGEARAVEAIKHSIAGGYAGIFEPKNGATQGLLPDDPSRPPGAVRKTASGWWLDKDGAVIMKPEFS